MVANNRVLNEKICNIEKTLESINRKIDDILDRQLHEATRLATLEERTETLKYFVYASIVLAIGALISTVVKVFL